jgi:hypothetical protein
MLSKIINNVQLIKNKIIINMLNLTNYSVVELSHSDMIFIEGGGILSDFLDGVKAVGKVVGYGVGYASGAVYDAIMSHGADVAGSSNAAAAVAYK